MRLNIQTAWSANSSICVVMANVSQDDAAQWRIKVSGGIQGSGDIQPQHLGYGEPKSQDLSKDELPKKTRSGVAGDVYTVHVGEV